MPKIKTKPTGLFLKKIAVCIFLILAALSVYAQSPVTGILADTVEQKNLSNSVISVLRSKDSALVAFTRAGKDGKFSVPVRADGEFIVMITHPYFGDRFENILLGKNEPYDLGIVYMTPKIKLLEELIIKSGAPIRIKGDTTIYTADSFKVRAGANVEELLRRLPGIQVDQSGQITAMGERVKKVLVDGEEFFGSDPGIATKNLRADQVKEVQVFDKKSDQAEFTGIDDGVRDKTINLKMKGLNGYFGKIEAAGGLKDKYNNSTMLNAFKNKRKIAGYGIMSNTGQTNLDWKDAQNYGGGELDGLSTGVTDDGGVFVSFGGGDESYWGGRNGIPVNRNAGIHYSNKFNNEKLSFNSAYKFSNVTSPGVTTTFSNTFLPDTSWSGYSRSDNHTKTDKHAFNMVLDAKLDSFNTLKWSTRFNTNSSDSRFDFYSEMLNDSAQFINNSTRNRNNRSDRNNLVSFVLWGHKFKKLSRTLSIHAEFNRGESRNSGFLYSLNNFYIDGLFSYRDTVDQHNLQNNETSGYSARIAYTEPIVKDMYLEVSYGIAYYGNSNERMTNTKSTSGKYEDLVDTLSNSFEFNRLVNTPGLSFRVTKKKYNLTFGSSVGFSRFTQKNITENTTTLYNFTNYFPHASFLYKIKPSDNLRINYNGFTTAPSLEQLQPTRVNTDPLNVYIGNPGLRQSFRHSFNPSFNSYSVLKEKYMNVSLNVGLTQNAFVQSVMLDGAGKGTYQTVNADGVYHINFYSNYGFKITKAKLRFDAGPTGSISRNVDFINQVKNSTKTKSYGIRLSLSKYVQNKYNFHFAPSFSRIHSEGTVNKNANAQYWQFETWGNGTVSLPKNFEFNSYINVQIREKDPRFTRNNNYTTWSASVVKRMLKNNALEIKLGVYDILDQNRGYQRNFRSYSFTETFYTTLRRFWLLTLTWNLSKNGKPAGFN
jgi:hypothetical protein